MSTIDIAEVRGWAAEGGAIARGYFNNVARQRKADRSWVTQADLEIEQMLRERIAARYPEHGVMGEEQGVGDVGREFVWCLDPIDGTGAFVAGLPLWCVSIGLLRHGRPYAGVVYVPLLDDCYWADAGGPAFRNGEPLAVREPGPVDGNDWIAVGSYTHRGYSITFPGKIRALSSVACDCCYVARGSAYGALIGRANLWDLAAGLAILAAAGGAARTLSGAPFDTAALIGGGKLAEPIVIGHPASLDELRGHISRR